MEDDEKQAPRAQAQTLVTRGSVSICNRWMERMWSAFLGNTIGLTALDTGQEWIAPRNPEFSVVVDGELLGVMDFGEVVYSEACSKLAATLSIVQIRPGLEFVMETRAFHSVPGLLRTTALLNVGDVPVHVTRAATDCIALAPEGLSVRTHGYSERHESIVWATEERAAAIMCGERGLFIGQDGGGVFELLAPEAGVCSCVCEEEFTLAPHARHIFPDTYLIPFTGDPAMEATRVMGEFLLARRQLRRRNRP